MNGRIRRLRDQSLEAVNRISAERARLVTEFYRATEGEEMPAPVRRARAFAYLLEHKEICINPGELIVGERGPAPKATPTYPEICLHSLEDLEILHTRPKVSFQSDDEVRKIYREEIIPFWEGKTHRDRLFAAMEPEWIAAYEAGVFTEFQEQRAPGHTVLGNKIYHKGMLDIIRDIHESMSGIDKAHDPEAGRKQEELQGMEIAAQALIRFAGRHEEKLRQMAEATAKEEDKLELLRLADVCGHVPAYRPETFHEALQYYWFVHLGVITELNPWDSFNPGRLDQHLYPFYRRELDAGTLTQERARELLQSFWIKFNNHPSPPKIGVTAKESATYTDFALINTGGLKPDGTDAVNELSYLILDVVEEMRILQPSSMVQISRANPDDFLERALKIVKTGFGQPSIFNTDLIVQELVRQDKTIEDARNGGASGCVETGAFGTEAYILTGYFNLPKVLEIALHNGIDPRTGKLIGLKTGRPEDFKSFDELMEAFEKQLRHFTGIKIRGNNVIETLFADHLPVPFLSLLIDDCIANGKDYNSGGARYNSSYIQGVGLGSVTDMLTALRYHVYDDLGSQQHALKAQPEGSAAERSDVRLWRIGSQRPTANGQRITHLLSAMAADFNGYEELRHKLLYDTPKYGNDDDYADTQAARVFDMFFNAVDGHPTPRGATHRVNMLPTTSHIYFGSVTGAMPDGRKAWEPLSEGISPVQGMDVKGPTAVVKSASKIDQVRTGGTLLNQKFTPQLLADQKGIESLLHLIRGYFRLNGHHIQFNVVTAETLRDAKLHPEKYRGLIVRVAGYSDYFNDLTEELQDEIIRRTEQGEF